MQNYKPKLVAAIKENLWGKGLKYKFSLENF
jgi:hypothetical protein